MTEVVDLGNVTVGLFRDGSSDVANAQGPPRRIDGWIIGAPKLDTAPPHDGEMHPDGDELLYLVEGCVDILLEVDGEWRTTTLTPGEACVVPRGVWHKVVLREPSRIVHVTPGPGGEHRMKQSPSQPKPA